MQCTGCPPHSAREVSFHSGLPPLWTEVRKLSIQLEPSSLVLWPKPFISCLWYLKMGSEESCHSPHVHFHENFLLQEPLGSSQGGFRGLVIKKKKTYTF